MIDYLLILNIKYKGCIWSLNGDSYEGLTWYDTNSISKPTKEELDSQWEEVLSIIKKDNCKTQAKQLLIKSDWSNLSDVQIELDNYEEFVEYRKIIRNFITNPVENPEFPIEPEARWKE